MSEKKTDPTTGKEMTEKQLDDVAGGAYGDLDFVDEEHKPNFDPSGSNRFRRSGDSD